MIGKLTFLTSVMTGKSCYFKNAVTIGRNPINDIQLPYPNVSREHARISISGEYTVKDLKSNNGTFVNDKIVSGKMPLKNGDIIRISNFDIKFELVNDSTVDPSLIMRKQADFLSDGKDTATGFMDIRGINLSDLEKDIRE